ncbi:MAG: PfkB family carbohydrate kinase [Bacteroidales bacterium]|jgi:rfaE bifunctional protein kinase chain/domain|nr:PfkB family carbohydrate kinase [Bacteroidales bacterium]
MNSDFINKVLPDFGNVRILIVGDIMLDVYYFGTANRMSPEFPVPVVNLESKEYNLGGGANVAANIKSLGAEVHVCSVIGNDVPAKKIRSLFENAGLDFSEIILSDDRKTTVKNRIISNNKQLLRIDDEDDFYLSEKEAELFSSVVERKIKELLPQVIILQDYNKGVLSREIIGKIIEIAVEKKIKICVDPKKKNFDVYDNAYIFKPNLKEFCEYYSISKASNAELLLLMQKFQQEHNISLFLLTMADKGIMISEKDGTNFYFPAHIRQIADVSGAGDTVISVASLLSAVDADIENIAYISNVAGGLACEKSGISTITVDELNKELLKCKSEKQ